MRIVRQILLGLIILAVAVAAILGGGYFYLTRRPFPQIDGTLQVAGLTSPVTVIRDKSGIPHIYAGNAHDLFLAQGYVQAQDRLWQMEIYRLGFAGRSSELSPTVNNLKQDKFVRTIGFRRSAEADLAAIDPQGRATLQAYADGVNAFITTHPNNLPIEFAIVGLFGSKGFNYKPDLWTPLDTLQWAKGLGWSLGGNYDVEVFNAKLLAKFGEEQGTAIIADLEPAYDYQQRPIIVPSGVSWNQVPSGLSDLNMIDAVTGIRGRDIGSNN
jgi:penicillin amidase